LLGQWDDALPLAGDACVSARMPTIMAPAHTDNKQPSPHADKQLSAQQAGPPPTPANFTFRIQVDRGGSTSTSGCSPNSRRWESCPLPLLPGQNITAFAEYIPANMDLSAVCQYDEGTAMSLNCSLSHSGELKAVRKMVPPGPEPPCDIVLSGKPALQSAAALMGTYTLTGVYGPGDRPHWHRADKTEMYFSGTAWLVCANEGEPYENCKNESSGVLRNDDTAAATPDAISKPWYGWDGHQAVELSSVRAVGQGGMCPNTYWYTGPSVTSGCSSIGIAQNHSKGACYMECCFPPPKRPPPPAVSGITWDWLTPKCRFDNDPDQHWVPNTTSGVLPPIAHGGNVVATSAECHPQPFENLRLRTTVTCAISDTGTLSAHIADSDLSSVGASDDDNAGNDVMSGCSTASMYEQSDIGAQTARCCFPPTPAPRAAAS
jgi:hypothetical protein